MTTFGEFIKSERERRRWTQTDFGAKLKINSAAISRIENDYKQLSSEKLVLLADIFEVDLHILKEIYYADKFAHEVFKNDCSENVFKIAEETVRYLKLKNTKQGKLKF